MSREKKKWVKPTVVRLPYDERTRALFEQAPGAPGAQGSRNVGETRQGVAA